MKVRVLSLLLFVFVFLHVAVASAEVSPGSFESEHVIGGGEFEWGDEDFPTKEVSGSQWVVNGSESGKISLLEGGEVKASYTLQEFEAKKMTDEVAAECMGWEDVESCKTGIESGETTLPQGAPASEIEDGAQIVEKAREYGTDLEPEVTEGLDTAAEWAGTLNAEDIAEASDPLTAGLFLVPGAFAIGVDIGNELDQLFGLPEWGWGEAKTEVETARTAHENEGAQVEYSESNGSYHIIPGYYLEGDACDGALYCSYSEVEEAAAKMHLKASELSCVVFGEEAGGKTVPCEEASGKLASPLVCPAPSRFSGCEVPEKYTHEVGTAVPAEVPAPNEAYIEEENHEHKFSDGDYVPAHIESPGIKGAPEIPGTKADPIVTKPRIHGPILPKTHVRELETKPAPREFIKVQPTVTPEEIVEHEKESEKKLIPEPYPGEKATEYKERLERLGFTDVVITEVAEDAENVDVGPDGVASVHPSVGSSVAADTKVNIGENPSTAPEVGGGGGVPGGGGGGVEGPTIPEIKLPNIGVLCTTFPFGVPCWLVKTTEAWGGAEEAIRIPYHFDLPAVTGRSDTCMCGEITDAPFEPVIEAVKPYIILALTIGVVVAFASWMMGRGYGTATGDDGQMSMTGPGF